MDRTDFIIKKRILLTIVWLSIVILSIYLGYDYSISNLNFSPSQPINFSHKAHVQKYGMKCTFCHYNVEKNEYSNIPTLKACMTCHVGVKNTSDIIKPLINAYDSDSIMIWNRLYKLPHFVHFNHSSHIRAMIDCSSCHGNVETIDSLYQATRLTMKFCLDCHRNPEQMIIPAREISGIFTNSDCLIKKIDMTKSESMTEPYFGNYKSQERKSVNGIKLPVKVRKGPENCSACHY